MMRAKERARRRRNRLIAASLSFVLVIIIAAVALSHTNMRVLQPAGAIAAGERQLLITAFLLMLIVVIPVFVILFTVAWRYRETNTKATYHPNWDHSRLLETVWWLIPTGLIVVLAVITWRGTVQYDPYQPVEVSGGSMTIQVVALDWRWLFIYPDHKVASVNELHLPINKSVKFNITADAPMNSFWIPELGGQIYAMPGMATELNLSASKPGEYYGSSANISGRGFANMHFVAKATSQRDFDAWIQQTRHQAPLTKSAYDKLAKPNADKAVKSYGQPADDLYGTIISKYMKMEHKTPHSEMNMDDMNMNMESM